MMSALQNTYIDILVSHVEAMLSRHGYYRMLLESLARRSFYSFVKDDDNRTADALNYRYKLMQSAMLANNLIEAREISAGSLPTASLLEVMVALATRCEIEIMGDPSDEHPERWFMDMLWSSGLYAYDDFHFNEASVNDICDAVLNRKYDVNGHGGLFTVINQDVDMRVIGLWDQMNRYLLQVY